MNSETRNALVLSYLRTRIGKATPRNSDITAATGLPKNVVEAALYQMRRAEIIIIKGTGNSRLIEIPDEGCTIRRNSSAARETVAPLVKQPEPVRVEHFSCPRCGVRNCARHSASFLTSGAIPAWRVAA